MNEPTNPSSGSLKPLTTFSGSGITNMVHLKGGDAARGPVMGLIGSVSAILVVFAKRVGRISRKPRRAGEPGTPRSRAKLLLALTSFKNKTAPLRRKGREEEEGYGDGGVWQRDILMGDKCQPLEFSGVIYYDSNGNQLAELPPKSPRASPLPSHFLYDHRRGEAK